MNDGITTCMQDVKLTDENRAILLDYTCQYVDGELSRTEYQTAIAKHFQSKRDKVLEPNYTSRIDSQPTLAYEKDTPLVPPSVAALTKDYAAQSTDLDALMATLRNNKPISH